MSTQSKRSSAKGGPGTSRRRTPVVAAPRRRRPWPVVIGVGALALMFGVFAVIGLGTDQHHDDGAAPADISGAAHPQSAAKAPAASKGPHAQPWQAPASQQVADDWNKQKPVQPYAVTIPRLRLQRATQAVGLTAAHTIAEAGQGRIGWYQSTPAPGQVGPAMLLGSLSGGSKTSVLGGIGHLVKGDTVLVTRVDSTTVQYIVDKVMRVRSSAFPTAQVYRKSADPTLRLIGYRGTGAGTSAGDVIVFATATHLLSPRTGS